MHDVDNAPNCEPAPYPVADLSIPPGVPLRDVTRQAIVATLSANDGNRTKTARQLGIGRRTLLRYLVKYGLNQEPNHVRLPD